MFPSVRKSHAKGAHIHRLVGQLFWSQIEANFPLKLCWVRSKDSSDLDALTRPESTEHVRLYRAVYDRLWLEWSGFHMYLISITAFSQRPSIFGGGWEEPFTTRSSGVDVLQHKLGHMSSSTALWFIFFPPRSSSYVNETPAVRLSWFPLLASASVRTPPAQNYSGQSHTLTRLLSHSVPIGHLISRSVTCSPTHIIPRDISGQSHALTRPLLHSVPPDHLTPHTVAYSLARTVPTAFLPFMWNYASVTRRDATSRLFEQLLVPETRAVHNEGKRPNHSASSIFPAGSIHTGHDDE